MRWLISNRDCVIDPNTGNPISFGTGFGSLNYFTLKPDGQATTPSDWQTSTLPQFREALVAQADKFPNPLVTEVANQKHVCLFVHGYNNPWLDVITRYDTIAATLFDGDNGLGECIAFDWPSKGALFNYLSDRAEARRTGGDLTNVLSALYDWMLMKQNAAADNSANVCKARTSIIAHSMGNYALEYAMNALWTRKNRPLLVSLLNEVLMVAADVDNDLFRDGEDVSHGDGEGLANMSYRITALYTGRDDVLGCSAGLKHFGKRRLGRSGLDRTYKLPDNVWDVDCSTMLAKVGGLAIHGEYFAPAEVRCYALMREILQGKDRSILIHDGLVPDGLSRTQPQSAPDAVAVTQPQAPPSNTKYQTEFTPKPAPIDLTLAP